MYHAYVCSPLHTMMNASVTVAGILTVAGVGFLSVLWPSGRLARSGLVLVALMGLGKVIVGLVPESGNLLVHTLGALGIPCGAIGILLLGLAPRRQAPREASISLILGALALVGFVLFLVMPQLGIGALERVASYASMVWLGVLGFSVLGTRARIRSEPATR